MDNRDATYRFVGSNIGYTLGTDNIGIVLWRTGPTRSIFTDETNEWGSIRLCDVSELWRWHCWMMEQVSHGQVKIVASHPGVPSMWSINEVSWWNDKQRFFHYDLLARIRRAADRYSLAMDKARALMFAYKERYPEAKGE